jgi:hypothetical protein
MKENVLNNNKKNTACFIFINFSKIFKINADFINFSGFIQKISAYPNTWIIIFNSQSLHLYLQGNIRNYSFVGKKK